mgnify:FL=1
MKSMLIEGDNLIAMQSLLADFEGKIDVMPIDPPYNTAIDYTGYKDSGFADGWTEFMRTRLEIAYKLLSEHGVMFIDIDENEFCSLYLLCSEIFGARNVMSMVWKKTNPRFDKNRVEKPLEAGIRRTHEFIVVCFKDKANTSLNHVMQPVWDESKYVDRLQPLETIIDDMGTNSSAKDELEDIFGERNLFQTPKPVKMIKELIRAASNKQSVVMDFFAGSGTTGHAVMELNREDDGHRKFILITNDENNICKSIMLPRLQKIGELYGCDEDLQFKSII